MNELPHLKPASKYVRFSNMAVLQSNDLLLDRLSVEHFGKVVHELKTSVKQMGKKMKGAPKDFKKQMDEFMEVIPTVIDYKHTT